jgi:hypothetical protein
MIQSYSWIGDWTIDKGISRSAVVEYEAGSHQSLLKENKVFAATWGIYPYENLSNRYFMFKDSSYYVIPEGDFNFK